MRLKIHPSFWAFALLLCLSGKWLPLCNGILCVILHECAHAYVASRHGYRLNTVTLMPYGAVLNGGENLKRQDALPIALAGPIANFLLAVFCAALWWCFPAAYPYTQNFFQLNLALGLFNLLPAYPLDGARVVLSLSAHPLRTLKGLRIAGIALSALFFALFIVSSFFHIQYTAGVLGIMLFLSATGGTDKERYHHIASGVFEKDRSHPLPVTDYVVHPSVPLLRILKTLKPDKIARFHVTLNGKERILSEEDMGKLCESQPLRATLSSINLTNSQENNKR